MAGGAARTPVVLGVDGGNSKTHLALARSDGTLLAAVAGPSVSHQAVGLERGMRQLVALVEEGARRAGLDPARRPIADAAALCLAGVDLPSDVRPLRAAIAATGIARQLTLRNDGFAPLRAGAPRGWGVAVICGAGVNAVGVAPDGRTAAFPALGEISGDWGGGTGIGLAALQAAVRARDGRGPRTSLERVVPGRFELRRPFDVTVALYRGRLGNHDLRSLAPVVFAEARAGDREAIRIVERLSDELATMAIAIIRRLRLARRDVDVVLGGAVLQSGDPALIDAITNDVRAVAPAASVQVLDRPPVLGALLLALDLVGPADERAEARLRRTEISPS